MEQHEHESKIATVSEGNEMATEILGFEDEEIASEGESEGEDESLMERVNEEEIASWRMKKSHV